MLIKSRSEFCQKMIGNIISYADKKAFSAGKTSGVLRGGAFRANW